MVTQINPFTQPGSWFRGALHVHTTNSDGRLTPQESVAFHREQGYHFLAITDHGVITDLSAQSEPGFLNIPGVEVSYDRNEMGESYHIVVVGARRMAPVPADARIQEAIDLWAMDTVALYLAHPYWSGMVVGDMMPLERLHGMEVYNTSSYTDMGKGLAAVHWDDVLARGKRWWGIAVDDTHGVNDDAPGGWVWVKAERLQEGSILSALKEGCFYASSGPEIHDFRVENGTAYVRCSPAAAINLVGPASYGLQRRALLSGIVTEAEFRLRGRPSYIRAECVDHRGHAAWTNPLFLAE